MRWTFLFSLIVIKNKNVCVCVCAKEARLRCVFTNANDGRPSATDTILYSMEHYRCELWILADAAECTNAYHNNNSRMIVEARQPNR